ncbi:hypothetical protein QBC47DRAFT_440028 [Echria macrotheca]|uniref:Uncharacterized protein n=1 Tax=Echria macrotheca TaxID=438768 RepID=A0AAJ0F168_9PEZI|nr:hypothetical protein QBC47DRAFT_440028 [Echria macrotheca]
MRETTFETVEVSGSPSDDSLPDGRPGLWQMGWRRVAAGWWWEIGSAVVSAVSMGLILIILVKTDGMTLADWSLPIQPNSLISVFTTVGKSALMVPIAGCLGQLAWQHFAAEPKSLDHIRVFDDASRGPWGALELIFVIGRKGYLARLLAAATVLAMGIEPFAQQVLEFGTRRVWSPTPLVQIAAATSYQSRAFRNDERWSDDPVELSRVVIRDSDITNAILGVKSQPYFHCPPSAENCTFPAFTTLGVCGSVTDRSKGSRLACETGVAGDITCTFTWSSGNMSATFNKPMDPRNPESERQHEVFRLRVEPTPPSTAVMGLTMTALRANTTDVLDSIRKSTPPKAELLTLRLYWCAQDYRWANVSAAQLTSSQPDTEPLIPAPSSNSSDEWLTFVSSTGTEYRIHRETHASIWDYLGTKMLASHVLMNTKPLSQSAPGNITYNLGTEEGTCRPPLEMYLYSSNLDNATTNLASLLSNYIRSRAPSTDTATSLSSGNDNLGDNANSTILTGSAWKDETYIEVRWVWISLPLAETLLTILLLLATIVSSRMSGLPVLGNSPLGLLFHGLDGHVGADREARLQSRREIVGVARRIDVLCSDLQDAARKHLPSRHGSEHIITNSSVSPPGFVTKHNMP